MRELDKFLKLIPLEVEEHTVYKGILMASVKSDFADKILVKKESMSWTEALWSISAMKTLVPRGQAFPEPYKGLAYELKARSYVLKWKGLLRKEPIFEPHPELKLVQELDLPIAPSMDLAEAIIRNQTVADLLRKARPDYMQITTSTGVIPPPPPRVDRRAYYLCSLEQLLKNPLELVIVTELKKHFYLNVLKTKEAMQRSFALLLEVSKLRHEFARKKAEELGLTL